MRLIILVLTLTAVFICGIGFTGDVSAGKSSYFELTKGGDYKTVKFESKFYSLQFSKKGTAWITYIVEDDYSPNKYIHVPDQGIDFLGYYIFYEKTKPETLLFYRP